MRAKKIFTICIAMLLGLFTVMVIQASMMPSRDSLRGVINAASGQDDKVFTYIVR